MHGRLYRCDGWNGMLCHAFGVSCSGLHRMSQPSYTPCWLAKQSMCHAGNADPGLGRALWREGPASCEGPGAGLVAVVLQGLDPARADGIASLPFSSFSRAVCCGEVTWEMASAAGAYLSTGTLVAVREVQRKGAWGAGREGGVPRPGGLWLDEWSGAHAAGAVRLAPRGRTSLTSGAPA